MAKEKQVRPQSERMNALSEHELANIEEQIVVKKRGSKSASIEATTTASPAEISEIIQNNYKWFNYPEVQSDEECAERLNLFFQECNRTGEIPTVEKMCLALGAYRQKVWKWETGEIKVSAARRDMIKKAKEILAAMDAELVSRGKIPQVTYIFRAKNFYNMADRAEVVLTPNNPLDSVTDPEERRKRIEAAVIEED